MQFVIFIACVAVVVAVTAFFRYQQLLVRGITELQAHHLITSAQIRALMFLSAKIWRETGVQMPDGKSYEQKEHLLSSFAKVDPKGAARLREVVEKALRGQDPFK
jgi:hypothetical protein